MNTLFFDCETTGLANFKVIAEHPSQPHIVQLGAMLCDAQRRVMAEVNVLIKPIHWAIPAEAAAVHGFTTQMATDHGLGLEMVLRLFLALCDRADVIVAHNLDFDRLMVRREIFTLLGMSRTGADFGQKNGFCTMKAATPILKLPGRPNLQEAHEFFTGRKFEGAHDAMADIRACAAVYWALQDLAAVPNEDVIEL